MSVAETGLLVVLFVALLGATSVAVSRENVAAATNAVGSVVLALLAVAVAAGVGWADGGAGFDPGLPLWVTAAGFLHSVGMLGWYESVWWWDHLTHTVSAALVAAALYAGLLVTTGETAAVDLSPVAVAAVTLSGTLAVGVFWELVELVARVVGERYDIAPVLVVYGWRDTALDIVFDFVGAVVVLGLNVRVFVSLAGLSPELTRTVLCWAGVLVVGGSLVLSLVVAVGGWSDEQ
jgi:hypothetical protein